MRIIKYRLQSLASTILRALVDISCVAIFFIVLGVPIYFGLKGCN